MPANTLHPYVLVIMGVSGTGKTTLAKALQVRTGWAFQEGDELHPPENVAKMRAGIPLTDEDRAPWLRLCAKWAQERLAAGQGGILTCSALKRSYREIVGEGLENLRFVYLRVSREVLEARLAARKGHYMPASLLGSQLDTLEVPTVDEPVWAVDATRPTDETAAIVMAHIRNED